MTYQQIEINKLDRSPKNARKTQAKVAMDELKASLLAHGLMQNLVVTKAEGGRFGVIAGGRRLEALRALQEEGELPKDYAAPCQIVDDENALELSIAENTVRHAMHPADEFEAFAGLIEQGLNTGQIAQRFGVNEKHVLQRLKLSRVAPKLIAEYRAGKLTLEQLEAFTITDDRKKQLAVYKQMRDWDDAADIRRTLTEAMVDADSKLAKFVGLDAYHAAGGKSRADLFGEDVYLEDPALLDKLVKDRLDAEAEKCRQDGWSWVEVNPDEDYGFIYKCERIQPKSGKFSAEQMKLAGCVISVSYDGKLDIVKGLVRPEDKKKLAKPKSAADAAKIEAETKDRMPDSLRRDLSAYRLGAAQAEIAGHPEIAFDLLVFNVTLGWIDHHGPYDGPDVSFRPHNGETASEQARAFVESQLEAVQKALPLDWAEADSEAEQFEQFRGLSQADKSRLLAYGVARTLRPKLDDADEEPTAFELSLALTGGEVAAYWRPSKENFLGRINREQLLEIGEHIFGRQWATERRNAKKGELAEVLHQAFAEPEKHGQTPEQVEKLKALLPIGMAFPEAPEPQASRKAA